MYSPPGSDAFQNRVGIESVEAAREEFLPASPVVCAPEEMFNMMVTRAEISIVFMAVFSLCIPCSIIREGKQVVKKAL